MINLLEHNFKTQMMKTKFYSLVFLLLINLLYCQNIGDYKSSASGNWTDYTKWQIYTASGWTAASQYPGQTGGNYAVTISDGHTISVGDYTNGNNNGPSLTLSYNFGNLIVMGELSLNINLELNNTSNLIIDAGTVKWNQNNVYLKLKQNADVQIINAGSGSCNSSSGINGYGFIGSSCSNNTSLLIGTLTYTNCAGSGNSIAGTFCQVNESGGTINATPIASSTSLCHNPSIASNNAITLTAPDNSKITATKTYNWYLDSAPNGFIGFTTPQNNSAINVNNLIPGNYTFRLKITITKSENSYSAEGTISIVVYAPVAGTINNVNYCSKYSPNNSISIAALTGNIVKWQSSTSSDFSTNVNDINSTQSIYTLPNNLTTDMYYRIVLSNGDCNGFSNIAQVKAATTTFNGTTWSNGTPNSDKKAIFNNNYTLSDNLDACSVEVNNNAIVTIPETKNLNIKGEIIINSGNILVNSDANLIQEYDNAINIGNITVKRNAKIKRLDYTFWGAPVSGQNVKNFSPNTLDTRFYIYNESNDYFDGLFTKNLYPNNDFSITPTEDKNTYNFTKGKGYSIRAPNNYTTNISNFEGTFYGIPNNGIININIQKNSNGFNLVGNPYPSGISFDSLYNANSNLIEPIVYFWTNANPNPPIMQGSSYDGANYAIRNLTDGVPAQNQPITEKPTDIITGGQGFIIKKTNSGEANLVFNNGMRIASAGKFFNARLSTTESSKLWLKLTTPAKNYNTILVGYVNGATNGIDKGYDTESITTTSDMFYSIQNDKKLVIQGRAASFNNDDVIPLGANFFEAGNYEISIAKTEGVFNNKQPIYLKDKTLGKIINLSEAAYQFNATAGEINNRFEIIYKTDSTLGAEEAISKTEETLIYENDTKIFIENKSEKITEIKMHDAGGRLINNIKPNSNIFSLEKSNLYKGLIIFKISSKNKTHIKKFLLK